MGKKEQEKNSQEVTFTLAQDDSDKTEKINQESSSTFSKEELEKTEEINQDTSSASAKEDPEKPEKAQKKKKKKMKTWKKVLLIIGLSFVGLFVLLIVLSSISNCSYQVKLDQQLSKSSYEDKDLKWPADGIAVLLPKPESSYGYLTTASSDHLYCTVARTDMNAFNDYIDKCKEKGFKVDSEYSDTRYEAKDSAANVLSLSFTDKKNEMTIDLSSKAYLDKIAADNQAYNEKKKQESANSNNNANNSSNSGSSSSSTSVSADLKSFLDSYEQFVDKYVAFMQKYKSSGSPASMMKEYSELMAQYSDFTNKVAAYDAKKGSMSQQDLAYYTQVITRCMQKLASVQ